MTSTRAIAQIRSGRTAPPKWLGLLRRGFTGLAGAVSTILISSIVIFAGLSLAPGDPVAQILGARATDAQRAAMSEQLGLNDPLPVRYLNWLIGVVQGDFGTSLTYRTPVIDLLAPRVPVTITLILLSALLILLVGISLGALGGANDRVRPVVNALTGVGVAIPGFVAASVLVSIFAVQLGWFPTYGAGEGVVDRIWHLALPAVALSLGWTAYVAQMTSAAVREEADKEHVRTARGRGMARGLIFRKHVLHNAAIPVMTASGLTIAGLVAGSVVVETAFAVNGIGALLVESVSNKDYETVQAIALIVVAVFVVTTTAIDLAQSLLDPRSRKEGGRR